LIISVPAAANYIRVGSNTSDKVSIFNDIIIDREMAGDVVAVIGSISIKDDVNGDVVSLFGNIDVNAKVTGQVVSLFGGIHLGEKAVIEGDSISIGKYTKKPGAVVDGQEIHIGIGVPLRTGVILAILQIIFSIFAVIGGIIIIAILRDRFSKISFNVHDKHSNLLKVLLIGFFANILITVAAMLLFITVVAPVLYLLIMAVAMTAAGTYIGSIMLRFMRIYANLFLEFIAGIALTTAVQVIILLFMPYLGNFIGIIIYLFTVICFYSIGFGAIIDGKL